MSDKTDKKSEETKAPASALTKEVQEAIALSTAMVAEALKGQQGQIPGRPTRGVPDLGPRCGECGQYEVACKKQHRQAVVWPSNPHFVKFFQGVRINGVTYMSNGPQHRITVPAEADIEYAVAQWTDNEQEISQGRVAEHFSGTVQKFNPAVKAWR